MTNQDRNAIETERSRIALEKERIELQLLMQNKISIDKRDALIESSKHATKSASLKLGVIASIVFFGAVLIGIGNMIGGDVISFLAEGYLRNYPNQKFTDLSFFELLKGIIATLLMATAVVGGWYLIIETISSKYDNGELK